MADRARDLKIGVLSDVDQFDLSAPAADLEAVGDAAKAMGSDLDQAGTDLDTLGATAKAMGSDLDKAGTDLDTFARDAKATATKVDSAFDKIAKSSKAGLGKVDDDARKAGKGLDDFKDEAHGSGREAAASFSGGFDDITGFVQETAANAFGGFGALGAAAGIAGALGLGVIMSALSAAKQRADDLAAAFRDAKVDGADMAATVKVTLDDLRENNELVSLAEDAKRFGIDWTTLVRAMSGSATDLATVSARMDEISRSGQVVHTMGNEAANSFDNLTGALDRSGNAMFKSDAEARAYTSGLAATGVATEDAAKATEEHTARIAEHAAALDAFTTPAGVYTGLLATKTAAEQASAQATADATKDQSDSWEDYAKDVKVSVRDYLAELETQVEAQEDWSKNLRRLAKRGVSEGVLTELEKMGPEGAPLVAKLTTASDKELGKLVTLFNRQGKAAATSAGEGIVANIPKVETAASRAHAAAAAAMGDPIKIPVGVSGAGSAAAEAHREMERYFRNNPVQVALTPGPGFRVNGRKVT